MRRKSKPNIVFRILFNPKVFTLILLVCLVAISIPISKNISKKYTIDQEILDLESEISELEAGNKNLKKIIEYFESDQFVEEQARLSLGLKKPGEEVVVISADPKVIGMKAGLISKKDEEDNSNLVRWWKYFFQSKKGL